MSGWIHHGSRTAFQSSHLQLCEEDVTSRQGERLRYVYVEAPGYALIVPRLSDGRFLVLKIYRVPLRRHIYEFPSGRLDNGESPATAARRELAEEAGCSASMLDPLGSFHVSAGSSTEIAHLFNAQVVRDQSPRHDPGEDIVVETKSAEEIERLLRAGKFTDALSTLAFFLALRRDRADPLQD